MAGDWIKLEHATLEKPEVALFAELLGVKVDEAIGILIRFWCWLDCNSRNGRVTAASRSSIETITRCVGFAAAMERIGWAEFDDDTHTMTIPNFARHNGNPAKSRALAADRASRFRNASVTQTPLPEKRREEKIYKPKARTTTKATGAAAPLPDWLSPDLWEKFREVRKKIRSPMTPYAETLLIKKLEGFRSSGHNAIAILENSIACGWKDFWLPKEGGKNDRQDQRKATLDGLTGGLATRRGRVVEPDD